MGGQGWLARLTGAADVVAWLQGGLGNQLFQLNAALNYTHLTSMSLAVSSENFRRDRLRDFELSPLISDISVMSVAQQIAVGTPYSRAGVLRTATAPGLYRVVSNISQARTSPAIMVGFFQDQVSIDLGVDGVLGRLQSLRLSSRARELVDQVHGRAVVHVRRGDYVQLDSARRTFGVLPRAYFLSGLEMLAEEEEEAIYFTDDPDYVHTEFKVGRENIVGPKELGPLETIVAMGSASRIVIPNSTFSWWAGEMVRSAGGVVAGPSVWFHDRAPSASPLRDHWLKIDNSSYKA